MSLHSIHDAAHTQDTDKSTTENEACYGKMMRGAIESENLNIEKFRRASPFFTGAKALVPAPPRSEALTSPDTTWVIFCGKNVSVGE